MMRCRRTIACSSLALVLAAGCGGGTKDPAAGDVTDSTPSPAAVSASPTVDPVERSPVDGEYTMTLTRQDVLRAGFRAGMANQIAGVWRVTFSLEFAQQFVNLGGGGITVDGYQGGFAVEGDRLTLTDEPTLVFEWRLAGKQLTLRLVDEASAHPVDSLIWTSHAWEQTDH